MIPDNLCVKCNKFKIANKKYYLCVFCNFERLHDGLSINEYKSTNLQKSKLKKAEKMQLNLFKDPLLNKEKFCSIQGCINTLYTKREGRFCQFHWKLRKTNEKIREEKANKIYRIKNISDKKIQGKVELSLIKKEEKQKYIEENGTICEGCGKNSSFLDYSHILSVGQREDLQNDRLNKNLLCRKCHQDWESWNPVKMFKLKCIWNNLIYIRKMDSETFFKIYFKCIDFMMVPENQKMDEIDNEFNKSQE